MATIQSAQEKLRIKQGSMVQNFNQGMGSFLGIDAGRIAASPAGQSYAAKISDPNMPNKWAQNLRRAFGA